MSKKRRQPAKAQQRADYVREMKSIATLYGPTKSDTKPDQNSIADKPTPATSTKPSVTNK